MKKQLVLFIVLLMLITACSGEPSPGGDQDISPDDPPQVATPEPDPNNPEESTPDDIAEVNPLELAYDQGYILYQLGLFDGVSPVNYEPNLEGEMNREEAMKMIVSALGWLPADESDCPFTDVSTWAKPFVARAYLNGIAIGTVPQDNIFGAKDPVTLQHLLTFYLRALGYETTYAYEHAIRLGQLKSLTDNVAIGEDFLKRYQLVIITYNALTTTRVDSARTLVEDLIREERITQEQGESYGLIKTYRYQSQRDNGPLELSFEDFEDEILNEDKAIVLFYQSGSQLSQEMMLPFYNAAVALADEAKAGQIERSVAEELLDTYHVSSFPTIKLFKKGEVTTLPPLPEAEALVQWIKNN